MLTLDEERAIETMLKHYAGAADRRDRSLMEACFTEDVTAEYGEPIGRFDSRDALVGRLMAMLGGLGPTLHFITNVVVTATAEETRARSYTHAIITFGPGTEPMRTAGIYDDVLVRDAAGWRIRHRVYSALL